MNKLYTVGDIAKKLKIKPARAAYLMRELAYKAQIIPVMDTPTAKFYDEAGFQAAKKLNKVVKTK